MQRGKGNVAKWDTAKGRELWDSNTPIPEIVAILKVTKSAITGYSNRHWPTREMDTAIQATLKAAKFTPKRSQAEMTKLQHLGRARMLASNEPSLPPLMSLTFDGVGEYKG